MNRRGFIGRLSAIGFAALLPVRMAKSKWRPEDIEVARFSDYDSVFDDFGYEDGTPPYHGTFDHYEFGTVTNQVVFVKRGTSGE